MSFDSRLGCKRLRAIGVSNSVSCRIVNQVAQWVKDSGEEWTVARLKSLKQIALNRMSGCGVTYQGSYIAHRGGIPKGPFRPLFKGAWNTEPGSKEWSRLLNATMLYSSLTHVGPEPTATQWKKFQSTAEAELTEPQQQACALVERTVYSDGSWLEAPITGGIGIGMEKLVADTCEAAGIPAGIPESVFGRDLRSDCESDVGLDWNRLEELLDRGSMLNRPGDGWLDFMFGSSGKRVPGPGNHTTAEDQIHMWILDSICNPEVWAWVSCNMDIARPYLDAIERLGYDPHTVLNTAFSLMFREGKDGELETNSSECWSRGLGKVAFIQEPGMKLRAAFNMSRIVNHCLNPMKDDLFMLLGAIPNDCTFDQGRAAPIVQRWLQSGVRVHSVDLSDATNMFPLRVQLEVLRRVGVPEDWLRAFDQASTGPILVLDPTLPRVREGERKRMSSRLMQLGRGTPMGLGPCFPAFALSHHAVIQLLRKELVRQHREPGDYFILGDDVIMRGEALHACYRRVMEVLGCPVSVAKCLSSNKAGEFAGKIITQDSVISTWKWRGIGAQNFVDMAKTFGIQAISKKSGLFTQRQREVLKTIMYFPEEYGGLGFNPKGIPYDIRASVAMDVLPETDQMVSQSSVNNALMRISVGLQSGRIKPAPKGARNATREDRFPEDQTRSRREWGVRGVEWVPPNVYACQALPDGIGLLPLWEMRRADSGNQSGPSSKEVKYSSLTEARRTLRSPESTEQAMPPPGIGVTQHLGQLQDAQKPEFYIRPTVSQWEKRLTGRRCSRLQDLRRVRQRVQDSLESRYHLRLSQMEVYDNATFAPEVQTWQGYQCLDDFREPPIAGRLQDGGDLDVGGGLHVPSTVSHAICNGPDDRDGR